MPFWLRLDDVRNADKQFQLQGSRFVLHFVQQDYIVGEANGFNPFDFHTKYINLKSFQIR